MKKIFSSYTILLMVFLSVFSAYAQTGVGKLSGKVFDEQTKEALIGANVVIVNSTLGGATNVDGNYFILNITPGTYDVKVSYVGYASKEIKGIRIVSGITYELNIALSTDLTLPTVIVTDKKFFEEKSTNTTKVFDSEEINRLPVKGVEKLAGLQSGVVIAEGSGGASGNATINVRGGRSSEVLYIIDGVPQNDVYSGANYAQVSNAAIEQISFQIGGYEAKYGQAQSGVINVTTKSGDPTYSLYSDLMTSTLTDKYGYNLYTTTLSGPIAPGVKDHTIFLSAERGWYLDNDPHAVGLSFNSDKKFSQDVMPNSSSGVWRFTGRTNSTFGNFNVRLGANINLRKEQLFSMAYAKNNPEHNQRNEMGNYSYSAKISQNISKSSFWNLNLGYKTYKNESGDGLFFNDLQAYGSLDALRKSGAILPSTAEDGFRVSLDDVGLFYQKGRTLGSYIKNESTTFNGDLDFTSQLDNHLFELGGGLNYNVLRRFALGTPNRLAQKTYRRSDLLTPEAVYYNLQPSVFGYDVTGQNTASADVFKDLVRWENSDTSKKYNPVNNTGYGAKTKTQVAFAPKKPIIAYTYIQDRFELNDIVLNIGLRADYMDTQEDVVANPELPFAGGSDPNEFDPGDYVKKKPEFFLSPRIGLGFPITSTTVFHAQYGKFIQQPPLNNLYFSPFDLNNLIQDDAFTLNVGNIKSEVTTQYEIGFRQVLGDVAALNLTAFYKNTEGLLNTSPVFFQRNPGGETNAYYTPTNSDFGTIKGFAISVDVSKISYFGVSFNYTYSLAEGTGSSTSSSYVAAFRNTNNEVPKVIAPLDFDQRHTGTINLDFYVPKDQLGFLEMFNANVLVSFNSGRPYTPLAVQHIMINGDNTQYGDTKGYINSSYGPSNFRVDLKAEKSIPIMNNLLLTPYIWIENLFNAVNPVDVYRSTGDPYTTGWLNTQEGRDATRGKTNVSEDYKSFERNPLNFGIPRMIRLGLKVNFSNIL